MNAAKLVSADWYMAPGGGVSRSKEGFVPRTWGPPLWSFLHTISFNYPVKPTKAHKEDYKRFFRDLGRVLPCGDCRKNYASHRFPEAAFKSRASLARFVYGLHNKVTDMVRKKKGLPRKRPPSFGTVSRDVERGRYVGRKKSSRAHVSKR